MVINESKGKYHSKGKHSQPASNKDRSKQPLSKAVAILEHRKKKGRNSNGQIEYKVQRESKDPQWEIEAVLKEDAPHLLEQYHSKQNSDKQLSASKQPMERRERPERMGPVQNVIKITQ